MSSQGFCNIVTDGTYFYSSNTYERVISRILGGVMEERFIQFEKTLNPLSLAIQGQDLYVYLHDTFGYIRRYNLATKALEETIPLASYSTLYPTMLFYNNDLYLSYYETGVLLKITPDRFQFSYSTGITGISGMAVALGFFYFSSTTQNAIYLISFDPVVVTLKIEIDTPRGLDSNGDSLYVCFGTNTKNCGIATYSTTLSVRTSIKTYFLFSQIPLNVLYAGVLYATMMGSNTLFRDNDPFSVAPFIQVKNYNGLGITQSVVASNLSCLQDPAFTALINLRTVGSNPNNPIPPVTDLIGRTSGNNIQFNIGLGTSYDSLQMRRKAETLQFRKNANDPGIVLSKKNNYKEVIKTGGVYQFSQAQLTRLLAENNDSVPCSIGFNNGQPVGVTPPSKSGIIDTTFEGYYLNPYVTYYPSL